MLKRSDFCKNITLMALLTMFWDVGSMGDGLETLSVDEESFNPELHIAKP